MSQEISAILDELSARFGATGAELWSEMVRYVVTVNIAWGIIAIAALYPVVRWFLRVYDESPDKDIVGIVGGGGLALFLIFAGVAIVTAIATLVSPQAATIQWILP